MSKRSKIIWNCWTSEINHSILLHQWSRTYGKSQKSEYRDFLTPSDFELYQTFSQSDFNNINDLLFGTIIVTGNYERQELKHSLPTFEHTILILRFFCRKRKLNTINGVACQKWMNKYYVQKTNMFLWILYPKLPSIYDSWHKSQCKFCQWTLVREHSLAFESIDENYLIDDLIRLTPNWDIIELQTPPTVIHLEFFPDFPNDNNSTF